MKKRALTLALALAFIIAFAPAAMAAPLEDTESTISWLDDSVVTFHVATPHHYLGNAKLGNLWNFDTEYSTPFSVFIIDDFEGPSTEFVIEAYTTVRNYDFQTFGRGDLDYSSVYVDHYLGRAELQVGDNQNSVKGTQDDPLVYTVTKLADSDRWFLTVYRYLLFDADTTQRQVWDYGAYPIGWISYSALVFTKSELAEYKQSGKFPTLYSEDEAVEYIDLSELYALLDEVKIEELTFSTASSAPATGKNAKIKTTEGLIMDIPANPEVVTKDITYTVAKGDNLAKLAQKHGTTVEKIKADNKAYFDYLDALNKKNGTKVNLEAGVTLNINSVVEKKPVNYTVQKGESLWGIAFNYYGTMSAAKVNEIYAANAEYFKSTKGVLEAGATIVLPANGIINPITQSSLDKAAGIYIVKPGDTLADIAKVYYNDMTAWIKIYEANKDRVTLYGTNSPMIYGGQWLVIPK